MQSTLSTNQLQQLENVMNIYTQLITLSDNFHFECGINIVEDTYLKEIFDCVRNKLDKLNRSLNYEELDSYELFINSAVPISEFGEQFDVLDKLEEIYCI